PTEMASKSTVPSTPASRNPLATPYPSPKPMTRTVPKNKETASRLLTRIALVLPVGRKPTDYQTDHDGDMRYPHRATGNLGHAKIQIRTNRSELGHHCCVGNTYVLP